MKKYTTGASATDAKRGKIWNRSTPKIRAGKGGYVFVSTVNNF